ncbi:ferredoxin--nitrite reductase [Prochlorococcus sp. MIT 1300]|nr:ferredoxin--nitrite reductase [Prochlorococcus sp. MIT 1300]
MTNTTQSKDLFSRFVNWLSELGKEKPISNNENGGQDPFSKLMNRISG